MFLHAAEFTSIFRLRVSQEVFKSAMILSVRPNKINETLITIAWELEIRE